MTLTLPKTENKPISKIQFLMNATAIMKKDRPELGMKASEWFKILTYMHNNGMLYATLKDGKIDILVGGFRVKEVPEVSENVKIPEKEEGNIMYIAFYVPRDKKLPLGAVKKFFKINKDIVKVAFEDNNGKIHQRRFIHREDKNVK